MKPVCLILGAGSGIGGNTARVFAKNGYHVHLCRRSDSKGLDELIKSINIENENMASGEILNLIEDHIFEDLINRVELSYGPIEVCILNLGAQIGTKLLAETTEKQFTLGWKMTQLTLFKLSKVLLPKMTERKKGTLIVTSSTASVRGNEGQLSHSAAMGGRRLLCQSLHAEFSPQGIHIAHVIIDGIVDAPDTVGKMLGEKKFNELKKIKTTNGIINPEKIAETYLHLASQHPSAWTFEMDIRSQNELAWWNSESRNV